MTKPLKVLAVSASGIMSGAERVLLDYASSGPDRAEQWTLAIPPGRFRDRVSEADLAWIDLPVLHLGGGAKAERLLRSVTGTVHASRVIRSAAREADVVVVNSVRALPAVWLARTRTPVAWLVHDVIEREGIRRLVRLVRSCIDRAIGVSEAAVAFARECGIPSTVVVNGTAWPIEPAYADRLSTVPVVGINGAITPWKGHRVFLDAAELVTSDARFEILGGAPFEGDRDYEASLIAQAEQSAIADRIEFLGQRDDPKDVMRRWSIAVSASIEPEAGPLAVLEAMSLGIAVIVTDHGGAPELAGDTGRTVPPGDAAALASAIESLLEDPTARADLGRRARSRVADRFTLQESKRKFGVVLRELTSGPPR